MKKASRGEKVIAFIERYCKVPEGKLVGQPMRLEDFQKEFITDVYDNPVGTKLGILSIARKNGKTGLIAGIVLAHVAGPEAIQNSQIVSGAMSRDQAALVFKLACKMIGLSDILRERVRIVPSSKILIGVAKNVEFTALAAEGKTAHGLSPVLAILDELGQVRGPQSDFIDAIITSQGAHENPLQLVISTQAPNDADMLSIWIDDAIENEDPHTVVRLHTAPADCDVMDKAAWYAANPALGIFRSMEDLEDQAKKAMRMPSFENTFRNLGLNQRVDMVAPFISRSIWLLNSADPLPEAFYLAKVYVGIDLSGKNDLSSMIAVCRYGGKIHVKAWFWTPEKGLRERSKHDRAPYDVWAKQGYITAVPGASVDYEVVAKDIVVALEDCDVVCIAFDRWRIDLLQKELNEIKCEIPLQAFGQGFKDMAPAIDQVETILLNEEMLHGANPVLTMCMNNARVEKDAAGNRKLNKQKATGRIDGAVALTMAIGVMPLAEEVDPPSVYEKRGILTV